MKRAPPVVVGLVSDSHGLWEPKLAPLLARCERILHAGDVVKPEILEALARIAPVTAVRGNNDRHPALGRLPDWTEVALGPFRGFLVHDAHALQPPRGALGRALLRVRPAVVIHGHSHRPGVRLAGEALFVNPGSAGPRRFSLPRTAALLTIRGRRALITFFDLAGETARPWGDPFEAELSGFGAAGGGC